MSNTIYFYKDRPLFGMDIGSSSIKFMQLGNHQQQYFVKGYGVVNFDESWISKGVIIQYEALANSVKKVFQEQLSGFITTNRVVISVPAAYTFSRIINLPKDIEKKDLPDAVITEIQQYLPSAIDELYSDYTILADQNNQYRVLTVASQKAIIDSYMNFAQLLGLEVVAMEPTTSASNRLFGFTDQHKVPTVLIDFGAISTDITVYDDDLVVSGTVTGGGDHYTDAIKQALAVSSQEAQTIKIRYGLNVSKKQSEIRQALKPLTDDIIKEVKRMVRYYEERISDNKKTIGQVVLLGGGANIPGLNDLLTNLLRLPVRTYDPWSTISFGSLKLPPASEEGIYTTSAGLALLSPEDPFI